MSSENTALTNNTETLVQLFLDSARRYPDRPAVSDDSTTVRYAELDHRSARLATALRRRGVGAEDRVGIYLNRSVDAFVAIIGVLRAGAAYVAVDSRYPDTRRDLMLTGGRVALTITEPDWADRLSALDFPVMTPDMAENVEPDAEIDHARPDAAASLIFTSGSSGEPKAIVLEHRNIVSFAINPRLPALTCADRTGQISSLSFDAFHFELWSTMAAGAEVVVLPPVPDLLAADFQREMRRRRISAMLVPTMVVNHVVREDRDAFAALRLLQAGGDVLLPSACREILDGAFRGRLVNLYGPAEIATACTAHEVTRADADSDSIPIGTALHGVVTSVRDPDGSPVAAGEIGELYVGGPGVARGYLDQKELTDDRFIADPSEPGQRLYRTGDLVRERPDGVLEFIGRGDNQVKIRGYRVELPEVERALRRHGDVHDAVVLPTGHGTDRSLVAFVVQDGAATIGEIRSFAEAELPDFMVPSSFIVVQAIPASDHGKRDLDALQILLDDHQRRQEGYAEPVTETERYLATAWSALLAIDGVGRYDDFFHLGGHSLLAFRLRSKIKRDLDVVIEHRAILVNTVLSQLAELIDSARSEMSPA